MLPPLFERAESAVLTVPVSAPADRRWDPAAAAESVRGADAGTGHAPATLVVVEDFAAGLREATALARRGTVVVTGSVHTVGNAMALLGIDPLG
jgi:folylpolyglutamate synthase/dihydropteroate synthase